MISSLDDPPACGRSHHRMPIFSAPDKTHSLESSLGLFAARAGRSTYRYGARQPRQAMIGYDAQRSNRPAQSPCRCHQGHGGDLALFYGSTVRDETGSSSDLDIFVDYDSRSKFNLLDLVDIKLLLESELGLEVDVTTRNSLHPLLKSDIEKTAVRVF